MSTAEDKTEILNEDLYALLGVEATASMNEIKKAWRKMSRCCHPDTTDDPESVNLFLKITKARDILTDETQRKNYEAKLKVKLMNEKRKRELDHNTKQLRNSLKIREENYKKQKKMDDQNKIKIQQQISQLKEEGLRKRKAEELERQKKLFEETFKSTQNNHDPEQLPSKEEVLKAHNDFEKNILEKMLKKSALIENKQNEKKVLVFFWS